ncbi:MAG TPA: diguanylate cyclase [Thauera sp.]|nr:diguanylate cyclase [Thauera sp.]
MPFPSMTQERARQWPLGAIRVAVIVAGILIVAFGWFDMTRDMRNDERMERARLEAHALTQARAAGEATQVTVDSLDHVLHIARSALQHTPEHVDALARITLDTWRPGFVLQLFRIDRDGYLAYSSLGPAPRNYLGDREYFRTLATAADDRLVVSPPVLGRLTNAWSLQIARALYRDGRFDGVVSIAVSVDAWSAQLRRFDPGPLVTLTLFGADGTMLLRSLKGEEHYDRQLRLDRPFIAQLDQREGTYVADSSLVDGLARFVGWSRLPSGLIMLSGIALDDALQPLRKRKAQGIKRATLASLLFATALAALLLALERHGRAIRLVEVREAHYRKVFNNIVEGVLVIGPDQHIISVNDAFCQISGHAKEQLIGRDTDCLCADDQAQRSLQALLRAAAGETVEGDFDGMRPDGTRYTGYARISTLPDATGAVTERLALIADVTELRRKDHEIWLRANFDTLTGLPNRALVLDRLEQMIRRARRQETCVVVLFIDLDRFKPVNDTYGHEFGDRLLCAVARRLERLFREEDTVSRLAGDEFVVLMPGSDCEETAAHAAEKIVHSLSEPFDVDGVQVSISASVGIACFPNHGETPESLIDRADQAMYRAKRGGRSTWRS